MRRQCFSLKLKQIISDISRVSPVNKAKKVETGKMKTFRVSFRCSFLLLIISLLYTTRLSRPLSQQPSTRTCSELAYVTRSRPQHLWSAGDCLPRWRPDRPSSDWRNKLPSSQLAGLWLRLGHLMTRRAGEIGD